MTTQKSTGITSSPSLLQAIQKVNYNYNFGYGCNFAAFSGYILPGFLMEKAQKEKEKLNEEMFSC